MQHTNLNTTLTVANSPWRAAAPAHSVVCEAVKRTRLFALCCLDLRETIVIETVSDDWATDKLSCDDISLLCLLTFLDCQSLQQHTLFSALSHESPLNYKGCNNYTTNNTHWVHAILTGCAMASASASVDSKAELTALLEQWERDQQGSTQDLVNLLTKWVDILQVYSGVS